jgi:hypothetical protein
MDGLEVMLPHKIDWSQVSSCSGVGSRDVFWLESAHRYALGLSQQEQPEPAQVARLRLAVAAVIPALSPLSRARLRPSARPVMAACVRYLIGFWPNARSR